ncbi:helix-turn-helix domain-containing protein [Streptomyces sp. NPDC048255]|uniref:helix-turn-helix domain-containing protein n=1 Tax=Streptomyces sp. NPDC048255 TaxID=3154713 RepID=UPI0033F217EC
MTSDDNKPQRTTYRNGDLHNALIKAGVELARQGGPEAVVLRAATRHVGVAPNAAYRHFADRSALLHAVSQGYGRGRPHHGGRTGCSAGRPG